MREANAKDSQSANTVLGALDAVHVCGMVYRRDACGDHSSLCMREELCSSATHKS
jgi:hypothetical protein